MLYSLAAEIASVTKPSDKNADFLCKDNVHSKCNVCNSKLLKNNLFSKGKVPLKALKKYVSYNDHAHIIQNVLFKKVQKQMAFQVGYLKYIR